MPDPELDVDALTAALDVRRQAESLSWRELSKQAGVQPSTLTRMHQGRHPDVSTFIALVKWLGQPAENFYSPRGRPSSERKPNPIAEATTLLRGDKSLSSESLKALEEIVKAAYKLAQGNS